jgi:hypothetical protein
MRNECQPCKYEYIEYQILLNLLCVILNISCIYDEVPAARRLAGGTSLSVFMIGFGPPF